jgi:hypothetical protein
VSDAPPSADDFVVRDAGYPLPEGWLTPAVAAALRAFYAVAVPHERLWIEEGALLHRSRARLDRVDAPALRDLLQRQAAAAAALEQVL